MQGMIYTIPKNSGTIKRDFEEAYKLMYADYNMEYFLNDFLPESIFLKEE